MNLSKEYRKALWRFRWEIFLSLLSGRTIGICSVLNKKDDWGSISLLVRDFESNKPNDTRHNEFFMHKSYIGRNYWWTNTLAGHRQRIKFLKHLIKLHKNGEAQTT